MRGARRLAGWALLAAAAPAVAEPPPGGSIAVRAVQGTPGAPPVGAAAATVQLYHRGVLVETIAAPLDEHGVALVEGLPLDMDIQPVAQVVFHDLTYQQIGTVMDAEHPRQSLEVVCYEPTEELPAWSVSMWHVLIDRLPQGYAVTELLVVENPGVRSWVGAPGPVAPGPERDARRVTIAFPLPANATDVRLARGFHDWCCTTRSRESLLNHLPLMPQRTEYKFSYVLPAQPGESVEVGARAPAPVGQLMVILPADIHVSAAKGLNFTGKQDAGSAHLAAYMASGLLPGDVASVTLASAAAPAGEGHAAAARIAAAVGGGLLLLGAAAVLLRPRRGTGAAVPPQEAPQ